MPGMGDGTFFLRVAALVVCRFLGGGTEFFSPVSFHFVPLCSALFHFVRILSAIPPMCATCFFARNLSLCSQALNKMMESLPVDVG